MCQGFAIQNKISRSRKMETWGHTYLWSGILRCLDPVNGGKLSFCGTVTFCLLSYTNEEDSLAAPPLNKKRSHVSAESEWEQSAICSFTWCSHMLVLPQASGLVCSRTNRSASPHHSPAVCGIASLINPSACLYMHLRAWVNRSRKIQMCAKWPRSGKCVTEKAVWQINWPMC